MIKLHNIRKTYSHQTALDNICFEIKKNTSVALLGINGAGKTTILDILCGCIGSDEGNASVGGYDILEDPLLAKKKLGYLCEKPALYKDMTVFQALAFSAQIHNIPKKYIAERIHEVTQDFQLSNVKESLVSNLSKGFCQRLAFAQALIHKPEVLILDEPTDGLDPNQIILTRQIIQSYKKDHTILISSHLLSEIEYLCDEAIIIDSGKILLHDTIENIKKIKKHKTSVFKIGLKKTSEKTLNILEKETKIIEKIKLNEESWELSFTAQKEEPDEDLFITKVLKNILANDAQILNFQKVENSLETIFEKLTRNKKNASH